MSTDISTYIDLPNGFRLHSRELGDLIREFTPEGMETDIGFAIQDEVVYMIVDSQEAFELRRSREGTLELHDGDQYRWVELRRSRVIPLVTVR